MACADMLGSIGRTTNCRALKTIDGRRYLNGDVALLLYGIMSLQAGLGPMNVCIIIPVPH